MNDSDLKNHYFDIVLKDALADLNAEKEKEAAELIESYDREFNCTPPKKMIRALKKYRRKNNGEKANNAVHRNFHVKILLPLAALLTVLLGVAITTQADIFDWFKIIFNRNPEYSSIEKIDHMAQLVSAEVHASNISQFSSFYLPNHMPDNFDLEIVDIGRSELRLTFEDNDASIIFKQSFTQNSFSSTFDTETKDGKPILLLRSKSLFFMV